jgi:hypothetical protein
MLGMGGGSGGALPPFAGPNAQAAPQAGAVPAPEGTGFGQRLLAGAQGFLSAPSPAGALGGLLGGIVNGPAADPRATQQSAVRGMLDQLYKAGKITKEQGQWIAANPESWKELSKAMISQNVQIAPSGDIIVTGPFGQPISRGAVPISERMDVTNPDGSKSPAFAVKPSLQEPQGIIVQPGAAASAAAPSIPGQPPLLNPNAPNGGRGIVTDQGPQRTEEQQATGKDLAAQYADITKKAAAATGRLNTLTRLQQLSPQAYEGAGAPALQLVRSFLTTLGVPSKSVPAGEEFTALANKMVLDANNGSLGTGVSNADVQFIRAMQPDLSQTRAGREQIIETARMLAKRDQEVAKLANNYRRQNGTLDGFQVFIQQWAEKNPLFANMASAGPPVANFNERFGAIADRPGAPGIRIIGVR